VINLDVAYIFGPIRRYWSKTCRLYMY